MSDKKRCSWVNLNNPLSIKYHDEEWGKPCYDDKTLFELLILEGAQAGLSWETILNKRQNYHMAYDDFDVQKVAKYGELKVSELLANKGIVRNRLKINSSIKNAKVFLQIQKEFGSFSNYIWSFSDGNIIKSYYEKYSQAPTKTPLSDAISKDLKLHGMSFVGSTIIYAYLQAIGIVDDHEKSCFCKS